MSTDVAALRAGLATLDRHGELQLEPLMRLLQEADPKFAQRASRHSNIRNLSRAMELEVTTDFAKAQVQREQVIGRLGAAMDKQALVKLVLASLQFKQGLITPGVFHTELLRLMEEHRIATEYEDLAAYSRYVSLMESLELDMLTGELKAVFRQVLEELEAG